MIYVVSHYYPPVQNPPARRMDALVHWLTRKYGAGNVTVVTGRPNHPEGKLAEGFRWRFFKSHAGRHDERVVHLYELPAPNRGFFRKTLGYISFAASVFFFFLFRRIKRDDIVLVTVPPFFTGYSIHVLSLLKRNFRYIVDVRDLWPQMLTCMGFIRENSLLFKMFRHWSDALYRRAIHRTGNVPGIVCAIEKHAPESSSFIPNTVDTDVFKKLDAPALHNFREAHPEWFPEGHCVILYAGTQSVYMGLDVLLRAVRRLNPPAHPLCVLLIGYGEEQPKLKRFTQEHGLTDIVKFAPHMDRESLVHAIGCADYCFASLVPDPIFRMSIPTKILEYLACGKFVLGAYDCDFVDALVNKGLAWNTSAGDDDALAELLKKALASPPPDTKKDARRYIEENFSQANFEGKWEKVFSSLLPVQKATEPSHPLTE